MSDQAVTISCSIESRTVLTDMRSILVGLTFVLSMTFLSACGNNSCKDACVKLTSCNLKSSGFSCDVGCVPPYDKCAVCLNDKSCADIAAGKCAADCPNATFTK